MNVILPMAGRGSRFSNFGYTTPKPFIEINGKSMFLWALKSIEGLHITNLIIIVLEEHRIQYNLDSILKKNCLYPYKIITLKSVTEGQLCTVMASESHVINNESILIISSDTLVISEINDIINDDNSSADGIISTMISEIGNNWSFVKLDELGNVIEVAEKNRISNYISTGLYYFKNSNTFFKYAHQLIDMNIRVNGEFYIIPVYELLLKNSLNVKIANSIQMWDMGNPEAKRIFEEALNNKLVLIND
jgi:NDP-sugar pyrophosphorylase family protein